MNALHAVILVVLALGTASTRSDDEVTKVTERACEPGRDVQVVLADRKARKLHTWTPNDCIPETFESYPVRKREDRHVVIGIYSLA